MKPCNECRREKDCHIKQFVDDYKKRGAYKLDSMLREYTVAAYVIKAKKDEIVLECMDFVPTKPQADYSYLVNRPKAKLENIKDCNSCNKDCKKDDDGWGF